MRKGYIGQRTRRRKRYINLFLFFILLIGATIYFVYSSGNTDEEIIKIERINIEKENITSINKLENKLFETQQRLSLREDLLSSLKSEIKILEDKNKEFISTIQLLNLENDKIFSKNDQKNQKLQKENNIKLQQLQKKINQLNQEIKVINESYLSIKKDNESINEKNNKINKQVDILKNNNNTLEMQKNIAFKKIEELNKTIEELNKMIIEKDELIKQMTELQKFFVEK